MFPLPLLTDQDTEVFNCTRKNLGQHEEISVYLRTLCVCLKYVLRNNPSFQNVVRELLLRAAAAWMHSIEMIHLGAVSSEGEAECGGEWIYC